MCRKDSFCTCLRWFSYQSLFWKWCNCGSCCSVFRWQVLFTYSLVASPSDKIEKADDLARWMRIVLDVWSLTNLERRPMVLYGLLLVWDSTIRCSQVQNAWREIIETFICWQILKSFWTQSVYFCEWSTLTGYPKNIIQAFAYFAAESCWLLINEDED